MAAQPDSLLEFPCTFPIKVMGEEVAGYTAAICEVAREFDPTFDELTLERRPSRTGRYLGLTLHVRVSSREQLDALYRRLSSHAMVKVVL